jgi:hypothetical protein
MSEQLSSASQPTKKTRRLLRCLLPVGALAAGVCLCLLWHLALSPTAVAQVATTTPWTVSIDSATGNYTLVDQATGWQLTGSLNQAVSDPVRKSGTDQLGNFTSLSFHWDQDGPLSGEIKIYPDRSSVIFRLVCGSARAKAPASFPTLNTPPGLHVFGYKESVFASPSFKEGVGPSPWLLFDNSARAIILSPAANYMTAVVKLTKDNKLATRRGTAGDTR